jgi:hypothetical protein
VKPGQHPLQQGQVGTVASVGRPVDHDQVLVGHVTDHEGWVDGAAAKQWWSALCRWFANLVASRPSAAKVQLPRGEPSRQHDQQIW